MEEKNHANIDILATRRQIEEFKDSFVWKDIENELSAWAHGFAIERANIVDDAQGTNPSTASVLLHMGDVNGRIKAVQYLLSLPDVFLGILKDKENDTRH